MDDSLPPAPSIFDPDFPSTTPVTAVLDRLSVFRAQEERSKSERRFERQKSMVLSESCSSDAALRRSMEVLGGVAGDLEENLKFSDLTEQDYREMVSQTVDELKRIQAFGVRFVSQKQS